MPADFQRFSSIHALTDSVPDDTFTLLAWGSEGHPEDHRSAPMKVHCVLREVVMRKVIINSRILSFFILVRVCAGSLAVAGDWPEWRGPSRDGTSRETGLPTKWTPAGENLVWKQPYGGRSAPIIMGGRVFLFNSAGEGETMQERVMALDANTGKLLWEHRLNVYESDVPPRRIAWSSPAGDPATGNIYVFGACNELTALSNDGKVLVESLADRRIWCLDDAWRAHRFANH